MTHFSKLATDRAHDAGFVAVLDEIRARRDEFARLRHIPQDMVAKLQGIGVYRAFVPGRFGGDDLSPADFCRLIEDISAADASTGWVASFGVSATYLAALPPGDLWRDLRCGPGHGVCRGNVPAATGGRGGRWLCGQGPSGPGRRA